MLGRHLNWPMNLCPPTLAENLQAVARILIKLQTQGGRLGGMLSLVEMEWPFFSDIVQSKVQVYCCLHFCNFGEFIGVDQYTRTAMQ